MSQQNYYLYGLCCIDYAYIERVQRSLYPLKGMDTILMIEDKVVELSMTLDELSFDAE